ncbi:asparagine synthase-related protein [Brevibacillus choshinensis]|uniref:asparagine synthase-related protein n=1 Tax=Brevibacillus choshinensis TaxID=54911 RepID=UPI002E1BB63B|nr:asparagine synthase-related protein [Brevibacillus choshinensis]MED4781390.1 asparagine synthase-related protein [Brevibacillus choshinensis]
MLITSEGITQLQTKEQVWENANYIVGWKGFVFILGVAAGVESVMAFVEELRMSNMIAAVKMLKGHFFLTVYDKQADIYYAFIDNSGAFEAFHMESVVSTSFLTLARQSGYGKERVSKESIIEFLNFGSIYHNRTLVDGIFKIDCNEIIVLCNHKKTILSKELETLEDACPNVDIMEFFRLFSQSVKQMKVSADLTGGVDSRLVCVLLDHHGVPFEAAITGMEGIQDVEVPKHVAKALKHELHISVPCVDRLEQNVPELFDWCDGMNDLFKHYRTLPHHKNREERGVDLVISGIGGEFFKENMWVQDFPFYLRKKANIRRFLRMRMLQIKCKSAYFEGEYKTLNDSFEDRVVQKLGCYLLDTNTKTYDSIYYHFRMKTVASTFISAASHLFGCYSPFLEYDLVRYGFHLKRRERFFNQYHRKMITRLNAPVAKIRTAEGGISVSYEKMEILKDMIKYIRNRTRRATKVLGRKLFHKTYLQESPEHPELFRTIRSMQVTQKSIALLKQEGILDNQLKMSEILDTHLGNMVTIALFMRFLEGEDVRGEQVDVQVSNLAVATV